ncbi:nucleotide sugar dehydrogenase [Heliobacillus mobilis]|uniref:UDP-glucose 6-dehydrogenase n=1 Tax=Heliobacterium mobile TaxID=28064 RepID=A0A6I3SLA8_HELMO|nr:nucleotide sugar dehydrogenase [Heliobacterium mobile]MTV49694.1 nucleotide sugar dehydrogenase [Heliobacterium mobile]
MLLEISVIGLGKLGLCTAACFASKGHQVYGYDMNQFIREYLLERKCPINETGLSDLLNKCWDNLHIATDVEEAIMNSDVTLIIVPTPSDPSGRFVNDYVIRVLESIGPVLAKKQSYHVVDVVSTVMPGSSENQFKVLLERLSGRTCGKDFGLVYNPEFIALGSVIHDFLHPDLVLIGASDDLAGNKVKDLYLSMVNSQPKVAVMSLLNAEITKLSLNCYVTMKISFANELASICEQIPGADVDAITSAIGSDSRVGSKYLKAGLGFGGPCFPRDNIAFQAFAREAGAQARIGAQVVAINDDVVNRLFAQVQRHVKAGGRVALLGLAYKPGTHIVEESDALALTEKLVEAGYDVSLHDPVAIGEAKKSLGEKASFFADPYQAAAGADAVLWMTNWSEYAEIDWVKVAQAAQPQALLVDSWRNVTDEEVRKLFRYKALGLGIE